MDAPDLISRAAERGLLDESRTRAALGGREATPERLAGLKIACARCGGPISLENGALLCRPCNLRVEVGPGERYVRRRKLGEGGFGEVWLAHDRELNRDVAVKALSSMSPDDLARFRREARLAARLSHPNIVPVYDVTDRTLVMEYIAGAPAGETPLTAEQAADVVRQAAEGVEHAHLNGVIHRDLKPANILVAGGRAYVTDFGLAKQVGTDSSLSVSGDVFGTPAYMAPEQARGRLSEIGPHTDVYALGATLYDLLARRPPFRNPEVYEVIRQVIEEEPPALPDTVDADLRTIVQKAMEKEPRRRYATAGAMADDLRRRLAGEPILARPPSRLERLRRRIRRNPPAWAAAAAALCVAAAAGWLGWRRIEERREREREAAALEVYRAAQSDFQGAMMALLGGGGDAPANRLMIAFEAKLERARQIDPSFEGGWFERAQFLRMTGDTEGARKNVIEGLKRRPDDPLGRIENGMLAALELRDRYGLLHERELDRAAQRAFRNPAAGFVVDRERIEQDPELVRWREIVERDIPAGLASAPEWRELPWFRLVQAELALVMREFDVARGHLEGLEFAAAKVVRGRISVEEGRIEEAIGIFETAITTDPRCVAAYAERADARLHGAVVRAASDARDWYLRCIEDCNEAERLFPAFSGFAGLRADGRLRLAGILADRNEDPIELIEAALADASADLVSTPSDPRDLRARAWGQRAQWESHHGGDAAASYARAAEFARLRCRADPNDVESAGLEGTIEVSAALWLVHRGVDVGAALDRGEAAYRRAVELNPTHVKAHEGLAAVRLTRAQWAMQSGGDAHAILMEGLGHIDDALRLEPDDVEFHVLRARLLEHLAMARAEAGGDPSALLTDARGAIEAALKRNPDDGAAHNVLGGVYLEMARRDEATGRDPSANAERGLASLNRAAALQPNNPDMPLSLACGRFERGEWIADHGGDPLADYRAGLDAADRGIELSPADSRLHDNRGSLLQRIGDWTARSGEDPVRDFQAAIESYARAIECRPDDAPPHQNLALVHMKLARRAIGRGEDPAAEFDRALAAVGRAVELNPRFAQAMETAGDVCVDRAEWRWQVGGDPSEDQARAVEWYRQALDVNPGAAGPWGGLGTALFSQAEWAEASRQDASELYAGAEEAFDRAIALKPDAWNALANKGLLLRKLGRLDEALAALERALQINPTIPGLRRDVEELRRRTQPD